MKTILLSLLIPTLSVFLHAQGELADLGMASTRYLETEKRTAAVMEPTLSAETETVDNVAFLTVRNSLSRPVTVQLLSPGYKLLFEKQFAGDFARLKIDLSGMEHGTYLLRVRHNDKTWTKQLVKQ